MTNEVMVIGQIEKSFLQFLALQVFSRLLHSEFALFRRRPKKVTFVQEIALRIPARPLYYKIQNVAVLGIRTFLQIR